MTLILRTLMAAVLSLAVALPSAAEPQPRAYTQAELDQMLAPVALYPDPLLSQVLMAATYPVEVVEAARWTRANPGLHGDDAVRAVQNEDWDPSVKSLIAFPQVLQRMDEKLEWTRAIGDAFLAQEPQVMDTVQQLRHRAYAAGNLQSSEQIHVQQQGQAILVLSASPRHVYIPYYDPLVVYGPWWWAAYQPVVWAPWPGYVRAYRPGLTVGFWWGRPVGLSANFFYGNFDWQRRHVRVVHVHNHYYRAPLVVNRTVSAAPGRWQHDPSHRRGVVYRVPEVRQRFAEFQPRSNTELRREEKRNPEERHQVLSRPPERQAQESQRQAQESQRRAQHDARESQRRAQHQAQAAQRQAQHQARQQAQEAERKSRQERRADMPAAQAPQQPRAERQEQRREQRQDRREKKQGPREARQENGQKG